MVESLVWIRKSYCFLGDVFLLVLGLQLVPGEQQLRVESQEVLKHAPEAALCTQPGGIPLDYYSSLSLQDILYEAKY